MTTFVDFADVKEKVSFFDTIGYLKLDLKQSGNQWCGPCPTCKIGGDRALVIIDGKGWFCFALKKGGDQIALAAHILEIGVKEAALKLVQMAGIVPGTSTHKSPTLPQSEDVKSNDLEPLATLSQSMMQ